MSDEAADAAALTYLLTYSSLKRTALTHMVGWMLLIHTGCPDPDDTTHRRTWGTIRRVLHHDIERDQATWLDQGSVTIRAGGWLNNLNPKKLRRVAGPQIF